MQQIESQQGLSVFYESGDRTAQRTVMQHILEPPVDVPSATAIATGLVWISPPGSYRFRADGGSLRVDDRLVDPESPLILAAGWHAIEVRRRGDTVLSRASTRDSGA
jgi:hypothetical protein